MIVCSPTNFRPQQRAEADVPRIVVQLAPVVRSPEEVVSTVAAVDGPLCVYCWYEGARSLPRKGAQFMRDALFEPLYRLKPDAKLCLYSLRGWNFFKNRTVSSMPSSGELGDCINRINRAAVACIESSAFFRYCSQISRDSRLYALVQELLPQQEWLFDLSKGYRKSNRSVGEFFEGRSSLFDCIQDRDLSRSYAAMQYMEGYYLIREAVEEALERGRDRMTIAFVLPNDEGKYYREFPKQVERMLTCDFGDRLFGIQINVLLEFFAYEKLSSRPYIDRRPKAPTVGSKEVASYFDYLKRPFLRDEIHGLIAMASGRNMRGEEL